MVMEITSRIRLMSNNQSIGSLINQFTCYLLISSDVLLLTHAGYNMFDVGESGVCLTTVFV